jgi:iron complex transport system ATP-binding protein
VLVVLHDLGEARQHADRGVLLTEGRVHAAGPIADIVQPTRVREVYGVDMHSGGPTFRLPEEGS